MTYISRQDPLPAICEVRPPVITNRSSSFSLAQVRGKRPPLGTRAMSYPAEEPTLSPASLPPEELSKKDVWAVMSRIVAQALQRLVSTQRLKSDIARQMLGRLV